MSWKRFCIVSLSLAWMAFPDRVRAQEAIQAPGYAAPGYSGPGYSSVDNLSGAMTLTPGGGTYLLFNKQTGQAVGIPTGYSRFGIRHAIFDDGPQQVFGEVEALITDTNRYGFNTGLGYRRMIDNALWGVNGWYDTIESPQSFRYQQAGIGVEYLSGPLDLRANGYVPIGNRTNFLRVVDPGTTSVFTGHDFATRGTGLFQQSLAGFDAEAGIPLPVINWMRIYAGMYELSSPVDDTWGVRSRIEGQVTQGVNVSVQVTNDDKFGTNVNVGVDIRFDGRLPTRFGALNDAYNRRYDQVRRQWQVQVAENQGPRLVPLNDPTTGRNIAITWVNNTAAAGGDGTIERPFQVLPSSAASDYVLVRRGAGDTVGNISLRNGQDLFGEGKAHSIDTDRLGAVVIPNNVFSNSGAFTSLRGRDANAPVITLADNTGVSGFNITGGTTAAILGTGADHFLVECVNVNSASGLSVTGGGNSIVRDSNFINTSPTGVGISYANTSGAPSTLSISNVTTQGGDIGTRVTAAGSPVTVTLANVNGSNHTGTGLLLDANGAALVASLSDSAMTNVGDGYRFNARQGGSLSGSVRNIRATGSGNLLEGNVSTGALNLQVTNATLSGSTAGNGVAFNLANATGIATFTNLTANNNAVDGVAVVGSGAATNYRVNVINSRIVGNGDDAVDATVVGGANVVVFVDPTAATGSGNNGFEFEVRGANSRLTAIMADTDYSRSGQDGINGIVNTGGRADLLFDRSPTTSNGVAGFRYNVATGGALSAVFNGGDLSSNPVNNVVGSVDGVGSQAAFTFNNTNQNLLASNGGFVAGVTNSGHLTSTWNGSNVSGTQSDGVRVTATGPATQVGLNFNNSLVNNNAGNGVIARLTGGNSSSVLGVTLTDSSIQTNGLDGLNLAVDGVGTVGTLSLTNTPIANNQRDGFEFGATGGAQFGTTITGTGAANNFSNNAESGIDGHVSGAGSRAIVSFDGMTINDSGQSGVLLRADQQGQLGLRLNNSTVTRSGEHGIDALATTNGLVDIDTSSTSVTQNQLNGLRFAAVTGGDITGDLVGGSFSNNGIGAPSSGVRGNIDGAGSTANITFTDVLVNTNTLNGFQLASTTGGTLTTSLTSTTARALSASNNASDGITLSATGAGATANLLMFGNNAVNSNAGNGLSVSGLNAQQVAVRFSGAANSNTGDGVHVNLQDVVRSAVELSLAGGTIQDNTGDGVEIDLMNSNLTNLTVNGTLVEALRIDGLLIQRNGGDGVNILANNSDATSAVITNNTIEDNVGVGLLVNLQNGSDWNLDINTNQVLDSAGNGIEVTSDSGTSTITVSNNTVAGGLLDNIRIDLTGTSTSTLHIDGNTVDGDGLAPTITPVVVRSFLSPIDSATTSGEPPDAMGSVGPNHLVELVNDNFRIYDKNTGALLSATTDEEFWQSVAGANLLGSDVFDHRIIFDPTTNRWIATTITRGGGNQVILAVSDSADPTGGWRSVQWQGDPAGANFNDFDTLGFDSDTVVVTTNDFGAGFSVSVFSIPKADLFGAGAPSIARMTRIQGLAAGTAGTALQAALDFGPSDGRTAILAVDDTLASSGTIFRTNILNGTTATATLSPATLIAVPNFNSPSNVTTPNGTTVRADSERFWSNTVEVNNELWAVHHVAGAGGLNEVRWYRIDEATNALISTGTIAAPGLSLFMPSIAVNTAGEIVIGYHAGSDTTAPSAYASAGIVQGNNVLFGTPTLLTAGTGEYGGRRWGDYSATTVDPVDSSIFWSILETGRGVTDGVTDFEYGEAFNAVRVDVRGGASQLTAGNGIHVTAQNLATIAGLSTINNNNVTGNGVDGIHVELRDNSVIESLEINGNRVTNNGGDGIDVTTTGSPTIGSLSVSNNPGVSNNGAHGIVVQLNDVLGLQDLTVDGNTVNNNALSGILVGINNTALPVTTSTVSVSSNTVSENTGFGIEVNLTNAGLSLFNASNNVIGDNTDDGLRVTAIGSPMTLAEISDNRLLGNLGNEGMFLSFADGPLGTLSIKRNTVGGALIDGMRVDLDNSPVGSVEIVNNNLGGGGGTSAVIDDSLPVIRAGFNGNTLASNDDGSTLTAVPLGFTADFFGQVFSDAFVNNNGNITFGQRLSTFTGFGLLNTTRQIIAPFFADVDTSDIGGVVTPDVTYGTGTVAGRNAFAVNWLDVRHFSVSDPGGGLPANSFQLVLIDRSDVGAGDFDMEFNYGSILWESGTASGGNNAGLGGTSATVGYSNGSTAALEFNGSRVNGALLDSGPAATSLVQNSINSANAGRYIFFARNGNIGTVGGGSGGDGLALNINNGSNIAAMLIDGNLISNNGFHGIDMQVADSTLPTSVVIQNNAITGQGGSGINIINPDTNGTDFGIDFLNNTITGNTGGPGIDIQLDANAGPNVLITSTGDTIRDNGSDGLRYQGVAGGSVSIDTATISGNGGNGVNLQLNGTTLAVTDSTITSNAQNGLLIDSVSGANDVTLTNNTVTQNAQDGLELINNSAGGLTARIDGSRFNTNTERGVAIFNRGSGQANVTLNDNTVTGNLQEGVYVVNTASADQSTRALSSVAMSNNGLVTATPDLVFDMNRNTITTNGVGSGLPAAGLVMRVGTADGGLADSTNTGGFADTRAGISATVRNNTLQGNLGADVFFQSFVSTVDPLSSQGTWNGATFNLTQFETDPLARLDLVYGGNTAGTTQATNAGAVYANDEPLFKSRTAAQTPAGPFPTGTRDRNAQRLADRDVAPGGTQLAPNAAVAQPSFQFPGVGESTFRVNLSLGGNVFGTGSGFILDGAPYVDVNSANGIGPALPFGWGTLP